MFKKDLSANVPLYGQEMCTWCGAASGQMSRNGYPNPADRLFYAQVDVWNTIQAHNSTAPADSGWATDPHGLQGCLQALANPPGVHWVEFANSIRDGLLFSILYWMNVREFPSPVLVNQGGHWVVIVGYKTDVEPVSGSSPVLKKIWFHDPEPHNVGTDTAMKAAQWYGGPWNGAVMYNGTWKNRYVAIIEPPLAKGTVKVESVKRTGTKLLSPAQAIERARRAVDEHELTEDRRYGLLDRSDAEVHEPMIVREVPASGRSGKNVPQYYIVPFGVRGEGERGGRLVRVCILVNAFTGDFEEVTAFGKPIRYLSRDEALRIAAAAMQLDVNRLEKAETALIFRPSTISHIRSYPFWQIKVGKRTMFVDQVGQFYGKLEISVPGD